MSGKDPIIVGGPYIPPQCSIGDRMMCMRRRREVTVDGFGGPLMWPTSGDLALGKTSYRGKSGQSPIVTEELVRMASTERAATFMHLTGCSSSYRYQFFVDFDLRQERTEFCPSQVDRPLLFGPYKLPSLKKGDLAVCKIGGNVKITNPSGPIKWPRCIYWPRKGKLGRPFLFVDDEFIRAISNESGLGMAYWFGIHVKTVTRLRKILGISCNTPGSAALHSKCGKSNAIRMMIRWTDKMVALLGTNADAIVAAQLGIGKASVANKRKELGIAPFEKPRKQRKRRNPAPFIDRSPNWPNFVREFKKGKTCAACGETECLAVHHIKPFQLFPELEFDEKNLIILCEVDYKNCHHRIGHCLSWHSYNPYVVEDAALSLSRIQNRPGRFRPQIAEIA